MDPLKIVLIILGIAFFVVLALYFWEYTKAILYKLMLQAKRMAKDAILNSGQEQEDWVVKRAMALFPKLSILGESRLRWLVKFLFRVLKDIADNGKVDDSTDKSSP